MSGTCWSWPWACACRRCWWWGPRVSRSSAGSSWSGPGCWCACTQHRCSCSTRSPAWCNEGFQKCKFLWKCDLPVDDLPQWQGLLLASNPGGGGELELGVIVLLIHLHWPDIIIIIIITIIIIIIIMTHLMIISLAFFLSMLLRPMGSICAARWPRTWYDLHRGNSVNYMDFRHFF